MNCQLFDQHYLDELDGLLDPPLASALHAHMDGCASCRHRYQDARDSLQMVRSWMAIREPSLALDQRIMAAAQDALVKRSASNELDQAPPRGLWAWLQMLLASPSFRPALAFCTVAMLVGSVYLYQAKYQEGLFQPKANRGVSTLQQMPPSGTAGAENRQEKSSKTRASRAGTASRAPQDAVVAKPAAIADQSQGTPKSMNPQKAPAERPGQQATTGVTTPGAASPTQAEPPRRMAPRRRAPRRRSRRRYRRKLAKRPLQKMSALRARYARRIRRARRTNKARKQRSRKLFKNAIGQQAIDTRPSSDTRDTGTTGLDSAPGTTQEQKGQKADDLSVRRKWKKGARRARKKAKSKAPAMAPSVPAPPAPRAPFRPIVTPRKDARGSGGADSPIRYAPPPPPKRETAPIVGGVAQPPPAPSAGNPAPTSASPKRSAPDKYKYKYNGAAKPRVSPKTTMNAPPTVAQSARPSRGGGRGRSFGTTSAYGADKRRHEGLSNIARQAARRGQTRRAIALYQQAIPHGTQAQRAEAHFQIATQHLKRNDLRNAKRHFALAIANTKVRARPSMYERITNAYRFRGKYQNAAEMLRRLIKLYPNRTRQYQRALRKLPNTDQ